MKNLIKQTVMAAVTVAAVGMANAADYIVTYVSDPFGSAPVTVTASDSSQSITKNYYAGLMEVKATPILGSGANTQIPLDPATFWTYCADAGIGINTKTEQKYELMDYAQAQGILGIDPAWGTLPNIYKAGEIFANVVAALPSTPAADQQNLSVAGQLAVWEALYDKSFDLTKGNFTATSYPLGNPIDPVVADVAQSLFNASQYPWALDRWLLVPYEDVTDQAGNIIGRNYVGSQELLALPSGNTAVPDGGATLAILGLAMAGLGWMKRK
jgi:hypothetical protein